MNVHSTQHTQHTQQKALLYAAQMLRDEAGQSGNVLVPADQACREAALGRVVQNAQELNLLMAKLFGRNGSGH